MSLQRFVRILRRRVRSVFGRGAMDRELDRELAFHLDLLTEDYIAEGLSPDDARHAAQRAFGNATAFAERSRDARRANWCHDGWQDVVHAWRLLKRDRLFTTVTVVSLALGIGANAAVLSVIDSVRLHATPFPNPEELMGVRVITGADSVALAGVSAAEFVDWQTRNDVFGGLGASLNYQMDFSGDEAGLAPDRVIGQAVTPGLFTTLGVAPLRGRWFTEDESRLDRPVHVVVLSYRLWQRRYGLDPDILTRHVTLDGVSTTIVGVMPNTFRFLDRRADFWVPLRINRVQPDVSANLFVAGRLKAGVTIEQAYANIASLGLQPVVRPDARAARIGVRVDPMRDVMYDWATAPLLTLQAAVALVLFIACANVAGLLLARGSLRERELALRTALGAGRGRIARQLLTESALLAALAGVTGVVVAWLCLNVLLASMSAPVGMPRLPQVTLDARTILLTAGIALVALVTFGIVPARSISRSRMSPALKVSAGSRATPRAQRSRTLLVVGQMAFALMLLMGAGLLLNSFVRLAGRDMHFDMRGLLTFDYRVPGPFTRRIGTIRNVPYVELTASPAEKLSAVYQQLRHVSGVSSVAGISSPLVNSLLVPSVGVFNDGRVPPDVDLDSPPPSMTYFLVTPHFFSTIRATLVAGRDIDDRDVADAPWVAVVNETAARRLWPDETALNKRLTLDIVPDERPRDVIGVVRDMPLRTRQIDAQPVVYVSYLQQPVKYRGNIGIFGQMSFLVRAADGDASRLAPALRQAVGAIDPDRPLANLAPLDDPGVPLLELRNYVSSVTAFAGLAMFLAAMGVYGVIASAVASRTSEIGIRRALGASTRDIVALVSRGVIGAILAGLALGCLGALLMSRLVASQLWSVTPTDVPTWVTACVVFLGVAVLACFVPARRALHVDAATALRCE